MTPIIFKTIGLFSIIFTVSSTANGGTLSAAIVPNADLVGKIDFRASQSSRIIEQYSTLLKSKRSPAPEMNRFLNRLNNITGLSNSDYVSLLFSANLENLNERGATLRTKVHSLNALAALELRKPFSIQQVKRSIAETAGTFGIIRVTDIRIGLHSAIKLSSVDRTNPDIYLATVSDKRTVFFGFNKKSIASGLSRAESGQIVSLPGSLSKVGATLPKGSQAMLIFAAPKRLIPVIKQNILKISAKSTNDPVQTAARRCFSLFKNLRSFAFGIKFDNNAMVSIAVRLGNIQEAQQTAGLLSTVLIPILQTALQQSDPTAYRISRTAKVSSKGSSVRGSLKMNTKELVTVSNRGLGKDQD